MQSSLQVEVRQKQFISVAIGKNSKSQRFSPLSVWTLT